MRRAVLAAFAASLVTSTLAVAPVAAAPPGGGLVQESVIVSDDAAVDLSVEMPSTTLLGTDVPVALTAWNSTPSNVFNYQLGRADSWSSMTLTIDDADSLWVAGVKQSGTAYLAMKCFCEGVHRGWTRFWQQGASTSTGSSLRTGMRPRCRSTTPEPSAGADLPAPATDAG